MTDLSPPLARSALLGAALALSACGGSIASGMAVGNVSRDLAAHSTAVPQGAEACALEAAAAPPQPGAAEVPLSETCKKPLKSDQLWGGSMAALAAYGATLETMAAGNGSASTGQVEAALTGIDDAKWIDVDAPSELAARDAAAELVSQIRQAAAKDDLEATIRDAAPHVETLCKGLTTYLDDQAAAFAKARSETEKKRGTRDDRRCGTIDNKGFCVTESSIDRAHYAVLFADLELAEQNHKKARNAVAAFCAAHEKLAEAATNGTLSDDATEAAIVEAVKQSRK